MTDTPRKVSDETYGTAAFIYEDEKQKWKVAKFGSGNVMAIRECGRIAKFTDSISAENHIMAMAARKSFVYLMDELTKAESDAE